MKYLNVLLRKVPYFDAVAGVNYPVAHLYNHGVCDKFLALLFPEKRVLHVNDEPIYIAARYESEIERRVENMVVVSDISRPPKRLTSARSQWTYDDTAWQFAVYLPLLELEAFMPQTFLADAFYHLHVVMLHVWYGCHPGMTYVESQDRAQSSLLQIARLFEGNGVISELRSNLHSAACHMIDSERHGGPLKERKELYVETTLGTLGAALENKVTGEPERLQARQNCVREALLRAISRLREHGIVPPDELYPVPADNVFAERLTVGLVRQIDESALTWSEGALLLSEPAETAVSDFFDGKITSIRRYERAILYGPEIRILDACADNIRRDCNVVCRDMTTYGEVLYLLGVTGSCKWGEQAVAILRTWKLVEKVNRYSVATLKTETLAEYTCVPLQHILGRVCLLVDPEKE